jgi:hypothetical protein
MASRIFYRKQALEREVKELFIKINIAGSGAPILASNASYGASSIARNSAGNYTLVLQDQYNALKNVEVIHQASSAQDLAFQVLAESVNSSAKSIQFVCLTDATPTDPASSTVLILKIELKNTSAV